MTYNPSRHHRRSIRLKEYDYSQEGLYFVTICCQNRECLFGEIVDSEMRLNNIGKIANDCWQEIPNHFPDAILHEYVIMPNHIHGIIQLVETNKYLPKNNDVGAVGANNYSPNNHSCENHSPNNQSCENYSPNNQSCENYSPNNHSTKNENIRANVYSPLRRSPSKTIGSIVRGFKIGVTKWIRQNTNVHDVWQRNYYEHVIRDEKSFQNIAEYIINNPKIWNGDRFYKK